MRAKVLLPVLVCFAALGAWAQTTVSIAPDGPSKEDVKKLFDVMASRAQVRQTMEQIFAQMRTMNREQLKKRRPDITEAELDTAERESEDLVKNFPLDEMLDDMIPIYQKHFTKADIEGLTAFYGSPVGQKFLHESPAVMAETMRAVYPRIQAAIEQALQQAEPKQNSNQN